MDMPYTIRRATPADDTAVNRLCVEAYTEFASEVGAANWQLLQESLSRAADLSGPGELLLAVEADELLGVVVYVPAGNSDGIAIPADWATIRMLAVSPKSRGRGIGKALTQECINRARRDGAQAIGLTTGEMMRIARPMYERLGFQKEAELGIRLGVSHARYVLRLNQAL
jgi:ribosomal protein S18 acetylase RimI-like enzyme